MYIQIKWQHFNVVFNIRSQDVALSGKFKCMSCRRCRDCQKMIDESNSNDGELRENTN